MNNFTNPDPYVTKVEDVVCRDCNKTFQTNAQYSKNGVPVSFRAKYCPECNMKPKITGNNGSWGTVNIESSKVPQRNVEGLEERFEKTEKVLHSTINLTFEHGKKIDELNKQNQNRFAEINDLEHNLNVFKSSQAEFNTKQSDFNISVLQLVKEIHKTLIVGFSLLIILMLVTWSYLTYTHFNH